MSHATETLYVHGTTDRRFLSAIAQRMSRLGFSLEADPTRAERAGTAIRRVFVRREAKWIVAVDEEQGDIDDWGREFSLALGRSVLTIFTWDGEASVATTRWKDGKKRAYLELLREAYRGPDKLPRAPAKVLWPWLPQQSRATILRDGVPLVAPAPSTGNAELDALLADINDVDLDRDDDPDHIYVPIDVSVGGLAAAIGLREPWIDPYLLDDQTQVLAFAPRAR